MSKATRSIAAKKAWMVRGRKMKMVSAINRKMVMTSIKKVKAVPGMATRPAKWVSPQSAGPTGMKGLRL